MYVRVELRPQFEAVALYREADFVHALFECSLESDGFQQFCAGLCVVGLSVRLYFGVFNLHLAVVVRRDLARAVGRYHKVVDGIVVEFAPVVVFRRCCYAFLFQSQFGLSVKADGCLFVVLVGADGTFKDNAVKSCGRIYLHLVYVYVGLGFDIHVAKYSVPVCLSGFAPHVRAVHLFRNSLVAVVNLYLNGVYSERDFSRKVVYVRRFEILLAAYAVAVDVKCGRACSFEVEHNLLALERMRNTYCCRVFHYAYVWISSCKVACRGVVCVALCQSALVYRSGQRNCAQRALPFTREVYSALCKQNCICNQQ